MPVQNRNELAFTAKQFHYDSTLTAEQQQALIPEPNQPLQLVDDKGIRTWYVISAEQYQAMQSVFSEAEFRPEELAPLIAQAAADAGWADPMMDDYDNYDEHRAKARCD